MISKIEKIWISSATILVLVTLSIFIWKQHVKNDVTKFYSDQTDKIEYKIDQQIDLQQVQRGIKEVSLPLEENKAEISQDQLQNLNQVAQKLGDSISKNKSSKPIQAVIEATPEETKPEATQVQEAPKATEPIIEEVKQEIVEFKDSNQTLYVKAELLNLRTSADQNSEKISVLNQAEQVTELKRGAEWSQIKTQNDLIGYVKHEYLQEDSFIANEQVLYVKADSLNVRKDPGTDSEKISELVFAAEVRELKRNATWSQISINNDLVGYVKSEYLQVQKPEAKVQASATAPAAATVGAGSEVTSMTAEQQQQIIQLARGAIGTKYVYAGSSLEGMDCSGFTSYIYREVFGMTIPRVSSAQMNYGQAVSVDLNDDSCLNQLAVGDIICYDNGGHVGVYIGDGVVIDASNSRGVVRESRLLEPYRKGAICGIRRIVN